MEWLPVVATIPCSAFSVTVTAGKFVTDDFGGGVGVGVGGDTAGHELSLLLAAAQAAPVGSVLMIGLLFA